MGAARNVILVLAMGLAAQAALAQSAAMSVDLPIIGFVDISTTGGTPITGVTDDSEHLIVTTIGNSMFPAGNVLISNNGVVVAGVASGNVSFTNQVLNPDVPSGFPQFGSCYLVPFWDDLRPSNFASGPSSTTIWWQEAAGVLYIMWKDEGAFGGTDPLEAITFEIQVFSTAAPCGTAVQYLYPDTVFGGTQAAHDHGATATVGVITGPLNGGLGLDWSFNMAVIPSGTVLSVSAPALDLVASSPGGSGSLLIQGGNSPCSGLGLATDHVLAITLNQGSFPAGWLFGLDIPVNELAAELAIGAPFVGQGFPFSVGPFVGLPPITIYAVAFAFLPNGHLGPHTNPASYTIP